MKKGYVLTDKHKVLGYDGMFGINYTVVRKVLSPIGVEFKIIGYSSMYGGNAKLPYR